MKIKPANNWACHILYELSIKTTSVLSVHGVPTVLPWGKSVEYFLAYVTWLLMLLPCLKNSEHIREIFRGTLWPPFLYWLLPRRSFLLSCFSLACTLVLLWQLPPILLCRRVFSSRVANVKCMCSTWSTCEVQRSLFTITKGLIFRSTCQCAKIKPMNNYCNVTIMVSAKIKLHK